MLLLFGSACGGSASEADREQRSTADQQDPDLGTNLPPEKTVDKLNPAETDELCSLVDDFREELANETRQCRLLAVLSMVDRAADDGTTDQELRRACSNVYEDCLADENDNYGYGYGYGYDYNGDYTGAESYMCNSAYLSQCSATVREVEDCLNATLDTFNRIYDSAVECSKLTVRDVQNLEANLSDFAELESAQECEALERKCP